MKGNITMTNYYIHFWKDGKGKSTAEQPVAETLEKAISNFNEERRLWEYAFSINYNSVTERTVHFDIRKVISSNEEEEQEEEKQDIKYGTYNDQVSDLYYSNQL